MKKKITMQDIADHLNISKNSVSQALTGKPGVSEATRKIIQQKAEELGYQYSTNKSKPKETSNIALIASDFAFSQKSFFGQIYLTIEKELKNRGMNVIIQSIDNSLRDNLELPAFIEERKVSGVLILSHISTDYINTVLKTGIPTVLIDHHHPFNDVDSVLLNNRFAAYKAVHHLIKLGHKRIGFVGKVNFSPSYQERFEGYHLALRDYNLIPKNEWFLTNIEEKIEDVNDATQSIIDAPTAWFCANDGFGFLMMSSLQARGLDIPKDVSVCSFDNGQLSQLSTPTTTTMNVDLTLYGQRAIELLWWRMENPDEPHQEILLSSELIKRNSTGPAPY